MLLIPLIFIIVIANVLNAFEDKALIKDDKPVNHTKNGWIYLSITVAVALFYTLVKHQPWLTIVWFLFLAFCTRQLVFDTLLNLLRGKAWNYVSPDPSSWVDKREKEVFGDNGTTPNYVYGGLFIVMLILIFF